MALCFREALQKERKVKESIDVKELGNKLTQDRTDINILSSASLIHHQAIYVHSANLFVLLVNLLAYPGHASASTRHQIPPNSSRSFELFHRGNPECLADMRRSPQDCPRAKSVGW